MPYILPVRRKEIGDFFGKAGTPGELNFEFTAVIKEYLELHGKSYNTFNDVLGALEGAKLEFYRRVVVPHEERKIEENGDVY